MLAVPEVVVKHVVARIESDGLLEFLNSLFMQSLGLVIDSQTRMQLLEWVFVVNVFLSKLLADDLVVLDCFLALS